MLSDEQLALRRTGITSTDASAILGINPFRSALEVYADKLGKGTPFDGNEATWWGERLENVVAKRYQLAVGPGHPVVQNTETVRSKAREWMLATPDAFVYDDGPEWGLECKTAMSAKQAQRFEGTSVGLPPPNPDTAYYEAVQAVADANGDRVPHEYLVQCAWCMEVCAMDRWDLAVLLAGYHGAEFRIYSIRRTPKVQALIDTQVARCGAFWQAVQRGEEPAPDGSAGALAALQAMHPQDDRDIIVALDDEADLLIDYAGLDDQYRAASAERETQRQLIMQMIGEHEGIETADRAYRATWKADKNGTRTFRHSGKGV